MELLYTSRPEAPLPPPLLASWQQGAPLPGRCALSCRNVLAFSVQCGREDGLCVPYTGHHVLTADLNTPWQVQAVTSSSSAGVVATLLLWHSDGHRLLVGWSDGRLQLMTSDYSAQHHQHNTMLDEFTAVAPTQAATGAGWLCVASLSMDDAQSPLAAVFFNDGFTLTSLNNNKNADNLANANVGSCDSVLYSDNFRTLSGCPTLRQWGGLAADGFVALSAAGQLVVCWLHDNEIPSAAASDVPANVVERHQLAISSRLSVATLSSDCSAFNGDLLVAASTGVARCGVLCWRVKLRCHLPRGPLSILPSQLPSVQLSPEEAVCVTHLVFSCDKANESQHNSGKADGVDHFPSVTLLVGTASDKGTSSLRAWRLGERCVSVSLPEPGAAAASSAVDLPLPAWLTATNDAAVVFECDGALTCVSCRAGCVLAANVDGRIFCLRADSLQLIASTNISSSSYGSDTSTDASDVRPAKMPRPADSHRRCVRRATAVCLSTTCHVAVALDNAATWYVWAPTWHETSNSCSMSLERVLVSLELCMLRGADVWDVLAAQRRALTSETSSTSPGGGGGVCDVWTERFARQPASIQQFHWQRHAAIRGWLLRLTNNNNNSESSGCDEADRRLQENTALILLRCAAVPLRAVFRWTSAATEDAAASATAALLAAKPLESVGDVDKVVAMLREQEASAGVAAATDAQLVAQMPSLCQWVVDVVLQILTSPSTHLARDRQLLQLSRELLVLVRRCGQLSAACAAALHYTSGNSIGGGGDQHHQVDAVAATFRLATRFLTADACDASAAAESASLPAPSLAARLPLALPSVGYLTHAARMSGSVEPLHYTFYEPSPASKSGALSGNIQASSDCSGGGDGECLMDAVRHVRLGRRPGFVRRCCRCEAVTATMPTGSAKKNSVSRVWEHRWSSQCLCGGNWVSAVIDD